MKIALTLIMFATLWAGSMAQSSGCTNTLISLSPCLNYITGNSSTPSSSCCTQLGSVVKSSPDCLCQALNSGGSSLGMNINKTQAMELPSACNVQTPPLSSCKASSPAGSPASGTSNSGNDGSNATPSIQASNGEVLKLSITSLSILFLASFTRNFIAI